MSTINITRDTSGKVLVNFDLPNFKLDLKLQADEIDVTLDSEEFKFPGEVEEAPVEESPEERKRRKAREYYEANKEKLRKQARDRYNAKKPVQPVSPDPVIEEIIEPVIIEEEDPVEAALKEERRRYYENHLQEIRDYYQANKERIAKRQQTEEARAKFREQYKARREKLTRQQIAVKNAKLVAQRKIRDNKLREKYPGMKLKHAKAAEKAAKAVAAI